MLIDITWPIAEDALAYPEDLPLSVRRISSMDAGAGYNLTRLDMTPHIGTHLDAPRHFIRDGAAIDELPLERFCVACEVVDTGDAPCIEPAHLAGLSIGRGEAGLFKTANSLLPRAHMAERWVYISAAAAQRIVELGLGIVGVDYIDVENPADEDDYPVHHALLGAGVLLLENLDLRAVAPGRYMLYCFPLRISGCEASPCRAVLER